MLSLKCDRSRVSSASQNGSVPPKYIILHDGNNNTIGRGLKSEIRIIFPWLSRRHATVLNQGRFCYIQCHGQNALFVNGVRKTWHQLHDKDIITIGGGRKGIEEGSAFTAKPGPYVEYLYHERTQSITDKENIYKYCDTNDSFSLAEEVNGRLLEEVYCPEDFNETQDFIDLPEFLNVKEEASEMKASEELVCNTRARRSSSRCKSRGSQLSSSQSSEASQQQQCEAQGSTTTESPAKPGAVSITTSPAKSPVKPAAKRGRKSNRKATATVSKPPATSAITSQSVASWSTAESSTSGVASTSEGGVPSTSTSTTIADDPWERFSKFEQRTNELLSKLDERAIASDQETAKTSDTGVSMDSDEVGCNFVSSMAKEEKRAKDTASSTVVKLKRPSKEPPSSRKNRGLSAAPSCTTTTTCINDEIAPSSERVENVLGNKDTLVKSPVKGIRKSLRRDRMRVDYSMPDDESDDYVHYLSGAGSRRKAPQALSKQEPGIESEEELLPDLDLVEHTEVVSEAEHELPNIPVTEKLNAVKAWNNILKRKRKANDDEDYNENGSKMARKGKGKATLKVNQPIVVRDKQLQALIDKWIRPRAKKVPPVYKEIADGLHFYGDVKFSDKKTFQLTFANDTIDTLAKSDAQRYECRLSVDVANLKNQLLTGDMVEDDYNKIFKLIGQQIETPKMTDFDKPKLLPNDYRIVQPEAIELKLKQYQLNTLSWMMTVEGKTERGWHTPKLAKWEQSGLDLMFDVTKKRVFMVPYPKTKDTLLTVKSKGGILADQMGLGKTITLLALFAKNRPPDNIIPDPETFRCQDQYHLPSGATLVIAPSHLTGQWKDEIETHTHDLRVLLITTRPQYEKLTYLDMMLADVVIVSVQFLLTNKCYKDMPTGEEADTAFIKLVRKPGDNPLLRNMPNLCHLMWWRIVADEAHELLKYEDKVVRKEGNKRVPSDGLLVLEKLKSKYRWYVTGTPFPHGEKSLRAALKYLEVEVDDKNLVYEDGSLKVDALKGMRDLGLSLLELSGYWGEHKSINAFPLHHVILNHLYVRNTKTSIGVEYNVPEFLEELILLTMSDVERGVYDRSISQLERRKLCCHMQIAERIQNFAGVQQKTLEEVRLSLIEQAHRDIKRAEDTIKDYEADRKRNSERIMEETDKATMKLMKARGERLKESVKKQQDEITKHRSAISYFDNIMPRIDHSADEPCVICLDPIEMLTVTPCGHLFCRKCIIPCIHAQHMCPTCRKPIHTEGQLLEVNDAKGRQELFKSAELRKLTETYGTKMAYLIFYLRNLFHDCKKSRVIVFSQWDSLLHKIGETLNENDIKNVFVKGNVFVRNRAIMSFRKQDKTRVIMLSLQNAASGTNLVEATHVVLIDPVAGSKEEAIAVESQAIGRAHRIGQHKQISVVRMIMKDTIEHELYLRNNSEDIAQVEFDFEKTGSLGGPQIVRTTRKVPDPDPAVLRTALQNLEPDPPPSGSRRRGRPEWTLGFNRNPPSMDTVFTGGGMRLMDFPEYGYDDDDDDDDDVANYYSDGGPGDCVLA